MLDQEVLTPDGSARFFVYGSLRPGLHNYPVVHAVRHRVERAVLRNGGVLYNNSNAFPYLAKSVLDEHMDIQGELFTVHADDAETALSILDRLEGFHGRKDPTNHYERTIVEVDGVESGTVAAYTYYVAKGNLALVRELPKVESGDWLTHILNS